MTKNRPSKKPRLLIFIVAYNAEKTITWVLNRIPKDLHLHYHTEILIIDDKSSDNTFQVGRSHINSEGFDYPLKVLYNPVNQGYGGNQKIGYHYAIKNGFDLVALVHGDGQYPPEELPRLVKFLVDEEADAVFGSRMMEAGEALKGGMPYYKYFGNRILTFIENQLLSTQLNEFHSGFRIYSTKALKKIPFRLNTNDFHFDTEIIIQLVFAKLRIKELPIPTYYGDEICHVNGIKYAFQVLAATMKARMQKVNLLYDRKYDCGDGLNTYRPKFNMISPHKLALKFVPKNSKVLDIGCAGGYVGHELKQKKRCSVFGIDLAPPERIVKLDSFLKVNLEKGLPKTVPSDVDAVLMLDILEHLSSPETFLKQLREHVKFNPNVTIYASTGNIAFFITRFLHLFGMFNYGKKGILDITHKRLFTRKTFISLFEQNGFSVQQVCSIPGPWQLFFGDNFFGRMVSSINSAICRIWSSMFAYQFFLIVKPHPHLDYLLKITKS